MRYHFHLESAHAVHDDEGAEFDTLHAAKCYAAKMMGEMLCNAPEGFWEADEFRVTVCDEKGLILFALDTVATMSPALRPTPPRA